MDTIVASVPDKAESAEVILAALPDMRALRVIPQQQEWDTVFFEEFKDPVCTRRKRRPKNWPVTRAAPSKISSQASNRMPPGPASERAGPGVGR